jgi:hypothetical protein
MELAWFGGEISFNATPKRWERRCTAQGEEDLNHLPNKLKGEMWILLKTAAAQQELRPTVDASVAHHG